jgi:hypothetical protein
MSVKRADGMGVADPVLSLSAAMGAVRPDGVHPKRRQAGRSLPPAVPVQLERNVVIAFALAWPCGRPWYIDQLAREGVSIAPVTIWRLLRRRHLGTRRARWLCWSRQCDDGSAHGADGQTDPPRRSGPAGGHLLSTRGSAWCVRGRRVCPVSQRC